ncbi:MAG: SOS response-associated peptidase [Alphaproteobacteria bacterium]|nr:SOS response-associated peptidase [Alphaproteobacteria bacterium]
MCGRFTIRTRPDALARAAGIGQMDIDFHPRFNLAPTQPVLAFRVAGGGAEAAYLRWGLIPSWAKDAAIGARMINARGETLAEKPSFRAAFRQRRCVVAADGFYEWRKIGGAKQPWFIRLRGDRPFGLAGLWERWRDPGGAALETCTIVTTAANSLVATVHERMPVLLADEAIARWLAPGFDAEALGSLIAPYPTDAMEAYPVSTRVNSPANDDATLVAPLNAEPARLV